MALSPAASAATLVTTASGLTITTASTLLSRSLHALTSRHALVPFVAEVLSRGLRMLARLAQTSRALQLMRER